MRWIYSQSRKPIFLVGAFYSGLTILFTVPTVAHIATSTPALGLNYVLFANARFISEQLQTLHVPYFIKRVFFPVGYPVVEGLLPSILVFLLGGSQNPVLGLNLSIFLSFLLASIGAYVLAYEVSRSHSGSLLAGFYYGFCAQHVANIGTYSTFHNEWLPWYFFALFRYTSTHAKRWVLLLSLCFFAAALSSWYFAVFLALATGLYFFFLLPSPGSLRTILGISKGLAVVFLLLVLVSPPVLMGLHGVESGGFKFIIDASADLLSFFLPANNHWYWGATIFSTQESWLGNPSLRANFLGYVSLLVALYGIFSSKQLSRTLRVYLVILGIAFWALSLGPYLIVGGLPVWSVDTPEVQIENVRLPYYWLADFLPFRATRATSRYSIVTILVLSVFLALGTRSILLHLSKRFSRVAFTTILFLLIGAELWPQWPMMLRTPVEVSPFYGRLNSMEEDLSVLELPFDLSGYRFLYYAAAHEKNVIGGATDKAYRNFEELARRHPLLRQLAYMGTPIQEQELRFWDIFYPEAEHYVPDVSRALNIRFAVVHKWDENQLSYGDYYQEQPLAIRVAEFISPWFRKVYEDDLVVVYERKELYGDWLFPVIGHGWGEALQHGNNVEGFVSRPLLGTRATIELYSSTEQLATFTIALATIFVPERDLSLSLNGENLYHKEVAKRWEHQQWETIRLNKLTLKAGKNILVFSTPQPAKSNWEVYGGTDRRKISFMLGHLSVMSYPEQP